MCNICVFFVFLAFYVPSGSSSNAADSKLSDVWLVLMTRARSILSKLLLYIRNYAVYHLYRYQSIAIMLL